MSGSDRIAMNRALNLDKRKREKEDKKKRKKKRAAKVVYARYIYKVMKEVNPEMEISAKAMAIMDNFMEDMFEKIVETAKTLTKHVGRATLTSMEIHNAVKMLLPGELAKHAMSGGAKAVIRYANVLTEEEKKSKQD